MNVFFGQSPASTPVDGAAAAKARVDSLSHSPKGAPHLPHPKYRADIDGLRAVAVLSVVGFHASPNWVHGGFIGVDVFFVISGFLISTIIFNGLENNSFSFAEFYARRVKRIFPALLVVLLACLTYGFFFFLQDEYKQLGKHVAAGASFLSNFVLWSESGYFDSSAQLKPLLHLWSLGIEEQFYIFWPILLWAGWKCGFKLLPITLGIAAASFAWNIYLSAHNPVADFYSPLTRFWELLCGAALARVTLNNAAARAQAPQNLGTSTSLQNAKSILGLAVLGLGFLFMTEKMVFPGWLALIPTVATALIISAGPTAWLNRCVLSNPVAVWFGTISFPLYLWHWPLLTFARIDAAGEAEFVVRIAAVLLAILLAWLTVQLIEKRLRFAKSRKVTYGLVACMAATLGAGAYCNAFGGFDGFGPRQKGTQQFADYYENSFPAWRYKERTGWFEKFRLDCDFFDMTAERAGSYTRVPKPTIAQSCYTRNPAQPHAVMLWGDSHAQQLNFGLRQTLPPEWQILQVAASGCRPALNTPGNPKTDYCPRSNQFALEAIARTKPDTVVISQLDEYKAAELDEIAARLRELGARRVIVAGPVPRWKSTLPSLIIRKHWNDGVVRTFDGLDKSVLEENRALKAGLAQSKDVMFADMLGMFCNQSGCLTQIGPDRLTDITSYDYSHLTPSASTFAGKRLTPMITATTSRIDR